MRTRSLIFVPALVLACAKPVSAQSTTLDFEEVSCGGSSSANLGSSYDRSGYRISAVANPSLSAVSLGSWCAGTGFGGSKAIFANNTYSSTLSLFRLDGSVFGIQSLRIANLLPNTGGGSLTFLGTTRNGATVTQMFTIPTSPAVSFVTYAFDATFLDLIALNWTTGPLGGGCAAGIECVNIGFANAQFDDIRLVSVVPEPAAVLLFVSGLVVLVAKRRRRRR